VGTRVGGTRAKKGKWTLSGGGNSFGIKRGDEGLKLSNLGLGGTGGGTKTGRNLANLGWGCGKQSKKPSSAAPPQIGNGTPKGGKISKRQKKQ